jgi:hypothetical protein
LQFIMGMSEFRSNMKTGLIDRPKEVFGIDMNAKAWTAQSMSRNKLPGVKALLDLQTFTEEENAMEHEDEDEVIFSAYWTHDCILAVGLTIYRGWGDH